jgi:transposase-like protein
VPHTFARPEEPYLYVEKEDVEGSCPECGSENLKRYPVLSEGGWWLVVKCQDCLYSLERERAGRMGSITLLSDSL